MSNPMPYKLDELVLKLHPDTIEEIYSFDRFFSEHDALVIGLFNSKLRKEFADLFSLGSGVELKIADGRATYTEEANLALLTTRIEGYLSASETGRDLELSPRQHVIAKWLYHIVRDDRDILVRIAALLALNQLYSFSGRFSDAVKIAESRTSNVNLRLVGALLHGRNGIRPACKILTTSAERIHSDVVAYAARTALTASQYLDSAAADRFVEAIPSLASTTTAHARWLLSRIPIGRRVEWLKKFISHHNLEIAYRAIKGLGKNLDKCLESELIELIERFDKDHMILIFDALGKIGGAESVKTLFPISQRERGDLRRAAESALAHIQTRRGPSVMGALSLSEFANADGGLSVDHAEGSLSQTETDGEE